jgi:hypothetical protein
MRIANIQPAQKSPGRPRSLAIVASLQILQSLILLGLGITLVYTSGWTPVELERAMQYLPLALVGSMLSGVVLAALGIAGLASALALLRMYSWAWMVAMLLQGLGLAAALWGYLNHSPNYIGMFLGVMIVFYLNQNEIQTVFRERRPAPRMEAGE